MTSASIVRGKKHTYTSDHDLLGRFPAVDLLEYYTGYILLNPPFVDRSLHASFKPAGIAGTRPPQCGGVGFDRHQGCRPFSLSEELLMRDEHGTLSTDAVRELF